MKTKINLLNNFIYLAILIIYFPFISCNKIEVDKNDNPQGYADSQVVGKWKIIGMTSDKAYDWDGNGVSETDLFSTFDDCKKDNLYEFFSDKKGIYKLSCNNTKNGEWDIIDAKILVWIPQGSFAYNEEMDDMTSNSFKTIRKEQIAPGQVYTIVTSWERQ